MTADGDDGVRLRNDFMHRLLLMEYPFRHPRRRPGIQLKQMRKPPYSLLDPRFHEDDGGGRMTRREGKRMTEQDDRTG